MSNKIGKEELDGMEYPMLDSDRSIYRHAEGAKLSLMPTKPNQATSSEAERWAAIGAGHVCSIIHRLTLPVSAATTCRDAGAHEGNDTFSRL